MNPGLMCIAALMLLSGCKPNSYFSGDGTPEYVTWAGEDYAIPLNYTLTGSGNSGTFIVASWPDMKGRPGDGEGYARWAASNIGILVSPDPRPGAVQRGIDITFKNEVLETGRIPIVVGERAGFKYSTRPYLGVQQEIYERFRKDGSRSAVMFCTEGRFVRKDSGDIKDTDQCELWPFYDEFPNLDLKISFKKPKNVHDTASIEKKVRQLLIKFRNDGAIARTEGAIEK